MVNFGPLAAEIGLPVWGTPDSFILFFSPNFSGRRLDVCNTFTHCVALVRIWNAGL